MAKEAKILNRKRGFTLIEVSVVIVILSLMATLIAPRMATTIEGGKRRAYRSNVLTLVRQARAEAIGQGQTVTLSVPSTGFQIGTTDANSNVTTIKTVAAVNGVQTSNFMRAGQSTGDTQWQLGFYPDGSTDGGSFQFVEANHTQSVAIARKDGQLTLSDGELDPATTSDAEWDAGGYDPGT